jgi:gliding motility-associated-like protein
MKKAIFILLYFFFFSSIQAQQNLVPNYSFEQKLKCVNTYDEFIGYVADWTGQGGNGEYLSWFTAECNSFGMAGVPDNEAGHQFAHTGNSYASISSYTSSYVPYPYDNNFRNYIQVQLTNPLKMGIRYCVVWYVSLGDTAKYACNDMGAYFSDSALVNEFPPVVKSYLTPQVANDPINNPLTDKINWIKITGSFVATGGEQYVVIGNFKDDSTSSIDSVGSKASMVIFPDAAAALYYIDDVSVLEVIEAHAGKDTLICNGDKTLIGKDMAVQGVKYNWLPITGLSNPNSAQTYASPTVTTTYTLSLINDSMKSCGCPDSLTKDSVTVSVCSDSVKTESENDNVFVPTAFSPNASVNNILYVRCDCISSMDFMIFDRWGNKVFESQDINKGWNGTHNGTQMNMGTYIWELNATLQNGTSIEKKGNVTLVR